MIKQGFRNMKYATFLEGWVRKIKINSEKDDNTFSKSDSTRQVCHIGMENTWVLVS